MGNARSKRTEDTEGGGEAGGQNRRNVASWNAAAQCGRSSINTERVLLLQHVCESRVEPSDYSTKSTFLARSFALGYYGANLIQ